MLFLIGIKAEPSLVWCSDENNCCCWLFYSEKFYKLLENAMTFWRKNINRLYFLSFKVSETSEKKTVNNSNCSHLNIKLTTVQPWFQSKRSLLLIVQQMELRHQMISLSDLKVSSICTMGSKATLKSHIWILLNYLSTPITVCWSGSK